MASLLGESLFEICRQGPAPSKDYYQLSVTKTEVIWRWWKISLRSEFRNARPGELKLTHQDYLDDRRLQSQVRVVLGAGPAWYAQALCRGQYDYLERLPDPLLLRILAHLELEDVARLGRTSHRFRQLCGSEELWERAVRCRCGPVSAAVCSLAQELGWRTVFFTSKLQLQKLLSRRRREGLRDREAGPQGPLGPAHPDLDHSGPSSDPSPDPSDPSPDPSSDPSDPDSTSPAHSQDYDPNTGPSPSPSLTRPTDDPNPSPGLDPAPNPSPVSSPDPVPSPSPGSSLDPASSPSPSPAPGSLSQALGCVRRGPLGEQGEPEDGRGDWSSDSGRKLTS